MEPFKVILIDDEPDSIISLEIILQEFCGDKVIVVDKVPIIDKAWDSIKANKPDLIFLDIDMPRGNGFDLLERFPIRKFDVIFITAYGRYEEKAKIYGAFDYLLKPIDIEVLKNVVEKFVAYRNSQGAPQFKLKM
ncbi:MAG TPA: response regulator [Bacteroidales bacterium]|jgi:two-component system LytT family response regulator|nr:response regulator [Bacteroidales bacterium]MDD4086953.1 response regulator [Bacteroidales bacterium]MDY0084972.1 response regulator [Bacteroidales bacterium]HPE42692.1 response regulator [Bacteroidales bacterium]